METVVHGEFVFLWTQWRRFTVTVVYCYFSSFFFVSSLPMSATTHWVRWLYGKYFAERSYYCYISSLFFSEHNHIVLPSPLLIAIFWFFSVTLPHGWVRPLVGISAYIGSNFLSDRIIAIYHHCFPPSTMASFHYHHCWLLYFYFFMIPPYGWLQPLVGIADSIGITFLINHIIAILILWSLIPFEVLCWAI